MAANLLPMSYSICIFSACEIINLRSKPIHFIDQNDNVTFFNLQLRQLLEVVRDVHRQTHFQFIQIINYLKKEVDKKGPIMCLKTLFKQQKKQTRLFKCTIIIAQHGHHWGCAWNRLFKTVTLYSNPKGKCYIYWHFELRPGSWANLLLTVFRTIYWLSRFCQYCLVLLYGFSCI